MHSSAAGHMGIVVFSLPAPEKADARLTSTPKRHRGGGGKYAKGVADLECREPGTQEARPLGSAPLSTRAATAH